MWPQAPCMYTSIQYMGMGMKQLNSSDKQTVVVHKWGKWQKFCLNQRYCTHRPLETSVSLNFKKTSVRNNFLRKE